VYEGDKEAWESDVSFVSFVSYVPSKDTEHPLLILVI
jgi:hypothetical protein